MEFVKKGNVVYNLALLVRAEKEGDKNHMTGAKLKLYFSSDSSMPQNPVEFEGNVADKLWERLNGQVIARK